MGGGQVLPVSGNLGYELQHRPLRHRLGHLRQHQAGHRHAVRQLLDLVHQAPGHGFQGVALLPQDCGSSGNIFHAFRIDLPQHRHHAAPQGVPGGSVGVIIGRILHMGHAVGGGVGRQLRPGDAQEGAADVPPHLGDTRKARRPGSPDQVQQHRLGVVVGVVGGEDGIVAAVLRRLVQKFIPQPPGGLLGGKPLPLR